MVLLFQQFIAMFIKRVLHTFRNWLVTATQLIVPLFFTSTALLTIKISPNSEASPPLLLNLDPFGKNYVPFTSGKNETQSQLTKDLANSYGSQFYESGVQGLYLNNNSHYASDPSVNKYIINEGEASLGTYTNNYLIAASFLEINGKPNATALFNDQAFHTPAITLNAMDNTLLQRFVNSSYDIYTVNDPLPKTVSAQIYDQINFDFNGFIISFNVMFGMAFLASSFVVFLIGERSLKAKHCQFVSGANWCVFWGATMLWDMINYMIPCLLLLAVFAAFDVTAYTVDHHLGMIFCFTYLENPQGEASTLKVYQIFQFLTKYYLNRIEDYLQQISRK